MKNEIGRKLTSLTIMAIMFAGLGNVQGSSKHLCLVYQQTLVKPTECYP